jgi:hypothetical protein
MKAQRLALVGFLLYPASFAFSLSALTPEHLWDAWPNERFVTTSAACLRPSELTTRIDQLVPRVKARGLAILREELGRSVQGRPIELLSIGKGARKILLWSQMHGDEPSATPALLDLVDYLTAHAQDDPEAARILEKLTLLIVPMLNPDGAEIYTRRNAQAIDINRDALNLATPEGRILRELRDRFQPMLGFNLHDQNRRRTVGDTRVLATNAVLAVTGDANRTVTPARMLAMRTGVAIARALEAFAPGGLARYDDEWSPRAFGDNLTAWGTPVLLIESGGVPPGRSLSELTRLNFVALLTALRDLAKNDVRDYDWNEYQKIPENDIDVWTDIVIRGSSIRQPGSTEAYRSDLAFNVLQGDRIREGCGSKEVPASGGSEVIELGDARIFGGGREIDATGRVLVPGFTVGVSGAAARRWLDPAGLERLAELGVARVVWVVDAGDVALAGEHAEKIVGWGRSSVEVSSDVRALPPLVLDRLPGEAHSPWISERIERLLAAAVAPKKGERPALANDPFAGLWGKDGGGSQPVLRPDAPATFLMLAPATPDGPLSESRVEAIWIDGLEVGATRR